MSYQIALEKAGCKILSFKNFGSYQGTWLAFVEYDGEKGIVEGSYGSCSGCDAFLSEFDFNDEEPIEEDGKYYKGNSWDEENEITKEQYDSLIEKYNQRLSDFGKSYLSGGLYDKKFYEEKLSKLKTDDWFDEEEKEYCEWAINQN